MQDDSVATIADDATATALVRLDHVSKLFGGVHALEDVSFELNKGDVVGLVGDNGAGKSTLVKMLSGVFGPSSGSILIEGEQQSLTPPARAQRSPAPTEPPRSTRSSNDSAIAVSVSSDSGGDSGGRCWSRS